jgi:hypothetical protein
MTRITRITGLDPRTAVEVTPSRIKQTRLKEEAMPKAKVPLPEINPATVKYTNTFSHIPVRAHWAAAGPVALRMCTLTLRHDARALARGAWAPVASLGHEGRNDAEHSRLSLFEGPGACPVSSTDDHARRMTAGAVHYRKLQ